MNMAVFATEFIDKINRGNRASLSRYLNKSAARYDPIAIRSNALHVVNILLQKDFENPILNWLYDRLNYRNGRYYFQGRQVFGWIDKHQVQACLLPLKKEDDRLIVTWEKHNYFDREGSGFEEAQKLPIMQYKHQLKVTRNIEQAGYAIALPNGRILENGVLLVACNYSLVLKNDKKNGYAIAYPISLKWKYWSD